MLSMRILRTLLNHVKNFYDMESVIKWRTGEPEEVGEYLITCHDGIHIDNYCEYECEQGDFYDWKIFTDDMILAWCPLNKIEPYKE